jgi:hypothetical protein
VQTAHTLQLKALRDSVGRVEPPRGQSTSYGVSASELGVVANIYDGEFRYT